MKYAVLSDVHGNCPALLKVLEDAKKRNIDHFIIAGDYCLCGAWPDECIKVLRDIPNKHIIRGNEERYLENLIGKDQSGWTDGQMQISYWNYRNIQREDLDYLLSLPQKEDFEENGVKIHIAHSSDQFIGEYEFGKIGPAVLAEKYKDSGLSPEDLKADIQDILDSDPVFQEKVSSLEDGIYIFGHSHVQWSYKLKGREVLLINPGSCGLPLDTVKDSIPYTILTIEENGKIDLNQIRLPFSKEQYVEELKSTTQYKEARVWTEVIIRELLTSREHLTFFLRYAEEYADNIGDTQRPFSVKTWEEAYDNWEKTLL